MIPAKIATIKPVLGAELAPFTGYRAFDTAKSTIAATTMSIIPKAINTSCIKPDFRQDYR